MKLKICGLMSLEDIECVNQADVDYAGFVFARGHRQELSFSAAKRLKHKLSSRIQTVGVFIDEPFDFIKSLADGGIIDACQFHGQAEYKMAVPTFRGFPVKNKDSIQPTACDFVIFDAPGHWNGAVGSTGGTFDWRLVADYHEKPFFLAGGIHTGNIQEAMALNPYGIDISSGAEQNGKKSLTKILEVAYACKQYRKTK